MPRASLLLLLSLAAAFAAIAPAQTTPCPPAWTPGFFPQLNFTVNAQVAYDDGTGPSLYVGIASQGSSPSNVLKLTVSGWQPVGNLGQSAEAFSIFNDGTGTKLYAAGYPGVSRWNGTSWSQLGSLSSDVRALQVATIGGTTSLYAGGSFDYDYSTGQQVKRLARWTGSSWIEVGGGLTSDVFSLSSFNDGSGQALYIGGYNLAPWNNSSNYLGEVARWNGSTFTSVGNLSGYSYIRVLHVFDGGSGPALCAGGPVSGPSNVVRWNGVTWTPLGTGVSSGSSSGGYSSVETMATFDDGSGPALYVGGYFATAGGIPAPNLARWNGTGWAALPVAPPTNLLSLIVFAGGTSPPALWAGGTGSYQWTGSQWTAPGEGLRPSSYGVAALAEFDQGTGVSLIAGGAFSTSGANGIARLGAGTWLPLGGTFFYGSSLNNVTALRGFNDGGGAALYAAGNFSIGSGAPFNYLARWNGSTWSSIGEPNGIPYVFADYDDGTGPSLLMGGSFSTIGGVSVNDMAKWNGVAWTPMGSGLNGAVRAAAVYDDGTGTALYIGGEFTYASGTPANGIAKWTGSHWAPVGLGVGGGQPFVRALAVYDSIGGPALYVGGTFTSAGGLPVQGIARLTGSTWSSVGTADNAVYALTTLDAGDGPALYAGGDFTTIGSTSLNGVAKWNGAAWSPLASGVTNASYAGQVRALLGTQDTSGSALWVGGSFGAAGGVPSSLIARYAAQSPVLSAPLTFPVGAQLVYGIQSAVGNQPYVFDFSINGSTPGFNVGTVHIPMNQPLINYTFGSMFPNTFVNFWGYLDANGAAQAEIHLPNDPVLAGFTLSSSFATLDFTAPSGISSVACPRTTTLIPAKPQIMNVSPPTAPATGGPTLSITGSGFQAGATVRIGAGYATNLTITPGLITGTAPAGGLGPVTVRVDNPNATSAAANGMFTYVTPIAISAVAPLVAPNGTTITIDGAGFQAGATVTLGGVNAPVTSLSPAQIHCTWPAGVPCNASLVVHDPDGQTASAPFNPSPTIGFVIGGTGPAAGGTPAFILGNDFHPGTTVTIGGTLAAIQSQNATSILVTVPPGSPGSAALIVTSASGCTASSTYVYY